MRTPVPTRGPWWIRPRAIALVAVVTLLAALMAGCSGADPDALPARPLGALSQPPTSTTSTTSTAPSPAATTATPAPTDRGPVVPAGDVVHVVVRHAGSTLIDARAAGLAQYISSPLCEVPDKPCYTAPTLADVARIDIGAPPQTPGAQTTFITGHSNRHKPDDQSAGVFSRLQGVVAGDEIEVTTTRGRFVYHVDEVLRVPFDQLPTTDAVVRVRKDTLVAISCEIAPDRASYLGNFVVVAGLASATAI